MCWFEIAEDEKEYYQGHYFFKTKYTIDFENKKKGDYGCLIEKEENLSQHAPIITNDKTYICGNSHIHSRGLTIENSFICDTDIKSGKTFYGETRILNSTITNTHIYNSFFDNRIGKIFISNSKVSTIFYLSNISVGLDIINSEVCCKELHVSGENIKVLDSKINTIGRINLTTAINSRIEFMRSNIISEQECETKIVSENYAGIVLNNVYIGDGATITSDNNNSEISNSMIRNGAIVKNITAKSCSIDGETDIVGMNFFECEFENAGKIGYDKKGIPLLKSSIESIGGLKIKNEKSFYSMRKIENSDYFFFFINDSIFEFTNESSSLVFPFRVDTRINDIRIKILNNSNNRFIRNFVEHIYTFISICIEDLKNKKNKAYSDECTRTFLRLFWCNYLELLFKKHTINCSEVIDIISENTKINLKDRSVKTISPFYPRSLIELLPDDFFIV